MKLMQRIQYKIPKLNTGLTSLIFIVIVSVCIRQIKITNTASFWVEHTHEVMFHSERLYFIITEAETGSRAYLLTGQSYFLSAFENSKNNLWTAFDTLRHLTADNPVQQLRIDTMFTIVSGRIKFSNGLVHPKYNFLIDSALTLAAESRSDLYLRAIGKINSRLQEEEESLLKIRKEASKKAEAIGYFVTLAIISILLVLLILLFWKENKLITDQIQKKSDESLRKMEGDFLAEISMLFNQAGNLQEILQKVVERMAVLGDFSVAEAWLIEKDGKKIKLFTRFQASDATPLLYRESEAVKSFAKGNGLPGIAWQTKVIQYWPNVDEDKKLIRRGAAKKPGLKTTCGIPIMYTNEVIGVIVLGSKEEEVKPGKFSTLFKNLGLHAGAEIRRKQLELELEQIFNFSPDIICSISTDGYFKKINLAGCNLLEYTAEELLAEPVISFVHPGDKTKSAAEVEGLRDNIGTAYYENRYITKSGKIKWLAWTVTCSPDEGLLLGVAKDITVKKELEYLLHKANLLARMGGWEIDLIKGTVYWSDITKEIHQTSYDFIPILATGNNFYKQGESRDLIIQKVNEAIEFGKPWDEELQIITAKNNERWVRTIGQTEFLNGKCIRIYGSLQDIDQQKKLAEKIIISEKLYRNLFENMLHGFAYCKAIMKDEEIIDYAYLAVNTEYEKLMGIAGIAGKKASQILPGLFETDAVLASMIKKFMRNSEPVKFENYVKQMNKWLSFSLCGVEKGSFVMLVDNITERKLADQKVQDLNTELEERVVSRTVQLESANKELESFSYSISHDLRAPLRVISGFGKILMEDYHEKLDEEGRHTVTIILSSAIKMVQLIDDLLNFSKLGRTEMRISKVDMNKIVKDVILELKNSGISIPLKLTVNKLKTAKGDINLLKQVWMNLISNAIKYSGAKEDPIVEIGMVQKTGRLTYYVKDNGAGFDMQYAYKLFGVFQRLHSEEEFTGTGVGLALVKRIIIRHEGTIWAEAKPNEGATFYFSLPEVENLLGDQK